VKFLLLSLLLDLPLLGHWPIPTSAGGVLQNLDLAPARRSVAPAGVPAPPLTSEMDLTITVRTRLDVTLICRTRSDFFNHDLPSQRSDPGHPGAECAQITGEKGSERIEDNLTRRARPKEKSTAPDPSRRNP
jgi:hypothetical protein